MEKYGFVYIWYDKWRKMYYVGCRWGNENDGYICSSNRMRDAYRRRPDDFKRRIISKVYTSRNDLLEEEYKWLLKIKPEELGKKYYNLRQHKWGHWSVDLEKRLSVSNKIKGQKRSQETILKMRLAKLGKKHTEEHKEKIRISSLSRKWKISESGKEKSRLVNIGKKHTKETKEKLRNAALLKWNSIDYRTKHHESMVTWAEKQYK